MDAQLAGLTIKEWLGLSAVVFVFASGLVLMGAWVLDTVRAMRRGDGFMSALCHSSAKNAMLLAPLSVGVGYPSDREEDDGAAAGSTCTGPVSTGTWDGGGGSGCGAGGFGD